MKITIEVPDYDKTKWNEPTIKIPEKGDLYINGEDVWVVNQGEFDFIKFLSCTPKAKPLQAIVQEILGFKTEAHATKVINKLAKAGYKLTKDPDWMKD